MDRQIHVERALSAGQLETPKDGHTRVVDMSQQLAQALLHLERERKAETLRRGWREMPHWVFCTTAGTPLDESKVRKVFARILWRAELPHFRVYDLRHTFATHLLARGVPITYVSAQLGHADATTTLRWYARWMPSPQGSQRAVDVLDEGAPAAPWHQFGTNRDRVAGRGREVRGIRGAERGIRTRDLPITNRLLYH